jgi:serine/threonine protein kinase
LDQLGAGQFGEVCKALWSISGATKELAIKTLRAELPEEEKVRFLQEAAIMGQFSHPNIVKLYGVVTVGDPVSTMPCMFFVFAGDFIQLSSLHNYSR